jgi:hypothetical protein
MLIGGLVQVGSAANPATAMDGTQTIRLVMFAIGLRFPSFSKALARWLRQIWPPQEASAMSKHEQEQLSTIERIERALVLLAYFIELDGDVHVPMYEKFEAELEDLKKKENTKARARKLLLSYAHSGALKAIC